MGGCFLGCFGLSSERKRRKHAHRVLSGSHARRLSNYEPLSCPPTDLDTAGNELRKSRDQINRKTRKKVRFNLEVQTYEPVPRDNSEDCNLRVEDQENSEKIIQQANVETEKSSVFKAESVEEKRVLYPANHRYGNCDEQDYEDDITCQESDIDDVDDDDYYYSDDEEHDEVQDDDDRDLQSDTHEWSKHREEDSSKKIGAPEPQERLSCAQSVLKPIENIEQWKAAKANRDVPSGKSEKKSAAPDVTPKSMASKPVIDDIPVAASLSSWLIFSGGSQSDNTQASKSAITTCVTNKLNTLAVVW